MNLAKQSTAKTILIGPVLDADGVAVTSLTASSFKITKNGTVGDLNASSTVTHNHTGHYLYAANGGDLDTLGVATISINSTTNGMAPVSLQVVPANVYDSFVGGSDYLQVDAVQQGGTTLTARDIGASVLLSSGTGTGQISLSSGIVKADIDTIKTQTVTCAAGVTVLASVGTAATSTAQTGDSFAIVNGDHGLVSIQDDVDAILADTNELQTDWANGGRLDLILDAAGSAGDPWATALPGEYGAGTAGKIVGDNINAPIATVDTVVDGLATELAKVPKSDSNVTFNATALASINAQADLALSDYDPPTRAELTTDTNSIITQINANETKIDTMQGNVTSILGDTEDIQTQIGIAGAGLTAINLPDQTMNITGNLSGSVGSVTGAVGSVTGNVGGTVARVTLVDTCTTNTDMLTAAAVNAEVDTALNTAIPTNPTAASINDYIKRMKRITCNKFEVDEDDGDTRTYDDAGTLVDTIAAGFTSLSTITKREKLA